MAYYTSVLATRQFDPVFNKSLSRSEFRLEPDSLYVSNFRLMNVGVLVNAKLNRYNLLVGAQPIKNIFLFDGKQQLDQVIGYGNLEGFRRYAKTNSQNCDVSKILKCHGLGFMYYREPEVAAEDVPTAKVYEFNELAANLPQTTEEKTPTSTILLNEVFGLLKNTEYIHTGVFKDLRVVIEWDTDSYLNSVVGEGISNSYITSTTYPLLVVDQVVDPVFSAKYLKEFKSIVYNAVETETVVLPHNGESANFKLTGFCNKSVQRLLIQKQGTVQTSQTQTGTSTAYRKYGSEAMLGETVQLVVDGVSWLPYEGLTRPNEKLGLLSDTFSVCNAIPGSNLTCLSHISSFVDAWDSRVGHLDYVALNISKKVQNLQLNYKRKAIGEPLTYSQQLIINVFGEVSKAIAMTSSGYQIVYL